LLQNRLYHYLLLFLQLFFHRSLLNF
jgi:hypothetical protein